MLALSAQVAREFREAAQMRGMPDRTEPQRVDVYAVPDLWRLLQRERAKRDGRRRIVTR